ncbi:MAG: signal peptidase I [Desulfovibrio sp.]|jgi:signal peptidase I|nr:signal peptidase I [Desulfovibrio sp.]
MPDAMYETPLHTILGYVRIFLAALCIAVLIRTFIIQPFVIPSESMLNTLQTGDRIFVLKFSYGIHLPFIEKEIISTGEPRVGDIIVFPFPQKKEDDYIKRVVGVPGDTLEMRNKRLYRNGIPADEPYVVLKDTAGNPHRDNFRPLTVPPGKVFVLGDNRDNSLDSRYWGFVDKDTVQGKAVVIYWSSTDFINIAWSRIGTLLR